MNSRFDALALKNTDRIALYEGDPPCQPDFCPWPHDLAVRPSLSQRAGWSAKSGLPVRGFQCFRVEETGSRAGQMRPTSTEANTILGLPKGAPACGGDWIARNEQIASAEVFKALLKAPFYLLCMVVLLVCSPPILLVRALERLFKKEAPDGTLALPIAVWLLALALMMPNSPSAAANTEHGHLHEAIERLDGNNTDLSIDGLKPALSDMGKQHQTQLR